MLVSRRTFMRAGTLAVLFGGVPLATVNVLGQRIHASPDESPVDQAAQLNEALANYTKATFVYKRNCSRRRDEEAGQTIGPA